MRNVTPLALGSAASQAYQQGFAASAAVSESSAALTLHMQGRGFDSVAQLDSQQSFSIVMNGPAASGNLSIPCSTGWSSFQHGDNYWSVVPLTEQQQALALLEARCHPEEDLVKNQHVVRPYGPEDFAGLRRCKYCGVLKRTAKSQTGCIFHPGKRLPAKQDPNRAFSCCGKTTRGCTSFSDHEYLDVDRVFLAKYQDYAATPPRASGYAKRSAVAIDCEMAGIRGAHSTLIQLSVVDYLTGEILINSLVKPTDKVVDWRTRISGVTAQAMAEAVARGEALYGWKEARAELWKYIDADTILVGHSLQNDLDALRLIHTRIVDSGILAKNAVGPSGRQWGLKGLCQELLRMDVQDSTRNGHDCTEDALAAREVVLWCCQTPLGLAEWAVAAKAQEEQKAAERKRKDQERKAERQAQNAAKKENQLPTPGPGSSLSEVLAAEMGFGPGVDLLQ